MSKTRRQVRVFTLLFTLLIVTGLFAQETTGGLQGTVKDPSGAIVQGATVTVTAPALVGSKQATSDSNGYYRFSNLPPATYTITATAQGFTTLKREGVTIEVGHLPTLDLPMQVGTGSTVVEVTEEAPLIDVTTTRTMTNITQDVINDVPHGTSFQSVIQFAPSARNEPLEGSNRMSNGSGGVSPGNGSNGNSYGFSVAGGSDSENSYLVEGQETANIIGGYSHTNVPFDFIQEVQVKTSGIEAEHGGALGGVANVIMKKGTSAYHGSVFMSYQNAAMNGSPQGYARYNPLDAGTQTSWGTIDPAYQNYQPIRNHSSDVFPGFSFGGPLLPKWKDKAYFFLGFNPEFNRFEEKVNYGPTNGGVIPFSQNTNTYYTTARVDVEATHNIRVFGSWLYQYQRENGENLPTNDSISPYFNASTGCFGAATSASGPYACQGSGVPTFAYAHTLGYAAPNQTVNTGVDWTINQHTVATSRFGYYFENYHDFGFPTSGNLFSFATSGLGATDTTGAPLPSGYQQSAGYINAATDQNFTAYNASKAIQFDQDVAWYKSGWLGTHNFKFGYQLNRLSNALDQHFNAPEVNMFVGFDPAGSTAYTPAGATGVANCAPFVTAHGQCQGQYGYAEVQDFGTNGHATSYNHAFFVQDAWTIGHGITINAGVRLEHEYLPGEASGAGVPSKPIDFGWGSKIAPRIGAAWDVFRDGRMKVFGSYGQFYDQMKLNLAISSFGGQYWQNCYYAIDTPDIASIAPAFNSQGRYCTGDATGGANWAAGSTPAGLTFLENQNFRLFPTTCSTCNQFQEGVAPGLKPYEQHEAVFGVDYAITKGLAFEARWDRRRLDHVIEDSSIFNQALASETFVIVNPGQGVDSTFSGFCSFLYGSGANTACTSSNSQYPPNNIIPAARSYDGVEFRLTKAQSNHWFGMFSYTYSKFRGNYTGLTSSELADGGLGGRNSPNNSRSFDEPYFSYNSMGGSSSGLLPTDRPNAFKGYAYYELGWLHHFTTDFGLFQYAYSGSPQSTYADVGLGGSAWPVYLFNRGEWADITQDPTTGAVTVGQPYTKRTPWYTQTDLNVTQNYKISESKALSFSATFTNLLNQHTATALFSQTDTGYGYQFLAPPNAPCGGQCYLLNGIDFYTAVTHPYNVSSLLNNSISTGGPITINSQYGKPMYYQLSRNIRLGVKFTF